MTLSQYLGSTDKGWQKRYARSKYPVSSSRSPYSDDQYMHERQHIPLHSIAEAHTTASCLENAADGMAYGVCKTQDRAFPVPSYSTWVPALGEHHRPSRFKVRGSVLACGTQSESVICGPARHTLERFSPNSCVGFPGTSHSFLCSFRNEDEKTDKYALSPNRCQIASVSYA